MTSVTITPNFPLGGIDGEFDPRVKDGRRFTLSREFRIVIPEEKIDIVVPEGFVTDFNSVPRVMWAYFAPWEVPEAGVVHDWLYRYPGALERGDCDTIHRKIMVFKGERASKARTAWLGLRSFGWLPWRKYRKAGVE